MEIIAAVDDVHSLAAVVEEFPTDAAEDKWMSWTVQRTVAVTDVGNVVLAGPVLIDVVSVAPAALTMTTMSVGMTPVPAQHSPFLAGVQVSQSIL